MNRTATMDRARKSRKRRMSAAKANAQAARQSVRQASDEAARNKPVASWQTFLLAGCSLLILWAALPPLGWSPLAWLAPVPLLWLVQSPKLAGRWPKLAIFTAAFLHWLLVLQGIRLAHPALYAGWIALAWYLAFYPLVFVVLARVAVHKARVPLVLAAPAIWVGLELARGYLLTGFSGALLGHTQYQWTSLIQISDLFGAYGVSFVVMLVAGAIATMLPLSRLLGMIGRSESNQPPAAVRSYAMPLATATIVLAATLGYGAWRLEEHRASMTEQQKASPPLRVALLQESVETIFDYDLKRSKETYRRYLNLAATAVAEQPETNLVVWPESVFNSAYPVRIIQPDATPPGGLNWSAAEFQNFKDHAPLQAEAKAHNAAEILGNRAAMLAGTDVFVYGQQTEHFNSAAFYSADGVLAGHYGKMHRVMFGEYIPFGDRIPFLYSITPMGSGLTPGREPKAFELGGMRIAPNVCFESFVPHLIRRQVKQLAANGQTPDVLINITNDGWFKGSAILDLHHACSVFRAVENRRPLLMAANIGITAEIDAAGQVIQKLPRYAVDVIHAELYQSRTELTHYTVWGDWGAGLCLLFAVSMAVLGVIGRFRGASHQLEPKT